MVGRGAVAVVHWKSFDLPLRKHTYSNILKILPPKTECFQKKILILFHISFQNIDCGYSLEPPRRGGSNEYSQSMLLSRNKKNNLYPCKPQFYHIKVGLKGVKIIQICFRDANRDGCYFARSAVVAIQMPFKRLQHLLFK